MEQVQLQQGNTIPLLPNLFPPMYPFPQTNFSNVPPSEMSSSGVTQPSPPQSPSQVHSEGESAQYHKHSHMSEQEPYETPTDLANLEQALIEKLHIHKKDPNLLGSYQATSSTSSMTTGTGGSEYDYQQSLSVEYKDDAVDPVALEVGFNEDTVSSEDIPVSDSITPQPASDPQHHTNWMNEENIALRKSRFVVSTVKEDPVITPNASEDSSPALMESPQALLEETKDDVISGPQRFHTARKGRFHVTTMQESQSSAASSFTNTPTSQLPDVKGLRVCTSAAQLPEVNVSLAFNSEVATLTNNNCLSNISFIDGDLNVSDSDPLHRACSPFTSSHNIPITISLLNSPFPASLNECSTQTSPQVPSYQRRRNSFMDETESKEVSNKISFLFYFT